MYQHEFISSRILQRPLLNDNSRHTARVNRRLVVEVLLFLRRGTLPGKDSDTRCTIGVEELLPYNVSRKR